MNGLCHQSHLILRAEGLATGYCRDVHGQVRRAGPRAPWAAEGPPGRCRAEGWSPGGAPSAVGNPGSLRVQARVGSRLSQVPQQVSWVLCVRATPCSAQALPHHSAQESSCHYPGHHVGPGTVPMPPACEHGLKLPGPCSRSSPGSFVLEAEPGLGRMQGPVSTAEGAAAPEASLLPWPTGLSLSK